MRQGHRLCRIEPCVRKAAGRDGKARFYLMSGPREDGNRQGLKNFDPLIPLVKLNQIVGSHQPDEPDAGVMPLHHAQRVDGISRA